MAKMRTIEECVNDIKRIYPHYMDEGFNKRLDEILEIHKAEKRPRGKWILSENNWNTFCYRCMEGKWKGYVPTPEEAIDWIPICLQCGADIRESEVKP